MRVRVYVYVGAMVCASVLPPVLASSEGEYACMLRVRLRVRLGKQVEQGDAASVFLVDQDRDAGLAVGVDLVQGGQESQEVWHALAVQLDGGVAHLFLCVCV